MGVVTKVGARSHTTDSVVESIDASVKFSNNNDQYIVSLDVIIDFIYF